MAVSFFPAILLLLLLPTTTTAAAATSMPPSPFPASITLPPHPHSPKRRPRPFLFQDNDNDNDNKNNHNDHLINIIDALIGSGDFAGWINLLSTTDPSSLPITATLFIPSNDAISHFPSASSSGIVPFDPLLVPYHIVPQRLTFADLRRLPIHTRLPTLLSSKYLIVTNNSASNFAIDYSQITMPDILENAAFSVHGIDKVLDYSIYGNGDALLPPVEESTTPPPPPPPPPPLPVTWPKPILPQPSKLPGEEVISSGTSSFGCSESLKSMFILSIHFAVFALPIG